MTRPRIALVAAGPATLAILLMLVVFARGPAETVGSDRGRGRTASCT